MDDQRLARCIHCGNEILLDAGDHECYVCHEPLPKPCLLAEPERARFTNIAGIGCLLIGQIGRDDVPIVDLRRAILKALLMVADTVGVSPREVLSASEQLARSKDTKRWMTEMTQL